MKYYYTIKLEMREVLRDEFEPAEIEQEFVNRMFFAFTDKEEERGDCIEDLEAFLDGTQLERVALLTHSVIKHYPKVNAIIWAESFDEYHADADRVAICVSPHAYAIKEFSWDMLESLAYEEMKEKGGEK